MNQLHLALAGLVALAACSTTPPADQQQRVAEGNNGPNSAQLRLVTIPERARFEGSDSVTVLLLLINEGDITEVSSRQAHFEIDVRSPSGDPVSPMALSTIDGGLGAHEMLTLPHGSVFGYRLNLSCAESEIPAPAQAPPCLWRMAFEAPGAYTVNARYRADSISVSAPPASLQIERRR